MKIELYSILLLLAAMMIPALDVPAQADDEVIVIQPLFEYPSAPDSVTALSARSNYLMSHFWDQMDFKSKKAVNQMALNDAFNVYITAMRFADEADAEKSLADLHKRLEKNPVLQLQFTLAAEETLYGPRAEVFNDHVYLQFIDNLMKNKKVSKERKARFRHQGKILHNTLIGSMPPTFDYETPTGTTSTFYPNGVITLIEFGDPDCDECRLSKLKLETDVSFNDLLDRGKVNVLFIIPDPSTGWQTEVAGYSPKWHVGASDKVADLYDLRSTPSIYVIDGEGKVLAKNISVAGAIEYVKQAVAAQDK